MKDFVRYFGLGLVLGVIFVMLTGCDDRYRYICQNPDYFYKAECQKPKCLFTQTCPEYLVAPVMENKVERPAETPPNR